MTIPYISGPSSTLQSQQTASVKLQAAIANIVSGTVTDNVADISTASQLQSQTTGLTQVSSNLVQALSLTQVADGGAQQVEGILSQIQTLAQQAQSPTLNDNNRQQLNQQFQQLTQQVDSIVAGTSFSGKKLLDGSLSGSNSLSLDSLLSTDGSTSSSDSSTSLSVADLSSSNLIGQGLNLLTSGDAGQVLAAVGGALEQVTGVRAAIGSFQQQSDYASATVDSALANQTAAQSNLSDTDFVDGATQLSLAELQNNASIAMVAQGNRLAPSMLQLIT